jgi:uncharacterized membrane protein
MSKSRLEAFSDGVFAVALTLLILNIHVPNIANHTGIGQYARAAAPLIPSVITFILTFVIICIHWVNHHYFFSHLKDVPLKIVWLNNLFLLWICFMPFPTAMLGNNLTDQFPIILYAVNQLLAAFTFFAFRSYAIKKHLFVDAASVKTMGPRHSVPAIVIYTLSIFLVFVNVYLSLACFVLIPLIYFVPNIRELR